MCVGIDNHYIECDPIADRRARFRNSNMRCHNRSESPVRYFMPTMVCLPAVDTVPTGSSCTKLRENCCQGQG
jgi:hypothetical protein